MKFSFDAIQKIVKSKPDATAEFVDYRSGEYVRTAPPESGETYQSWSNTKEYWEDAPFTYKADLISLKELENLIRPYFDSVQEILYKQRLEPTFVVFEMAEHLSNEQIVDFAQSISNAFLGRKEFALWNVVVAVIQKGKTSIQELSAEKMAELGWVRK